MGGGGEVPLCKRTWVGDPVNVRGFKRFCQKKCKQVREVRLE